MPFSGATGDSVHLAIQVILSHEIQLIQPDVCLAAQDANLSDDFTPFTLHRDTAVVSFVFVKQRYIV